MNHKSKELRHDIVETLFGRRLKKMVTYSNILVGVDVDGKELCSKLNTFIKEPKDRLTLESLIDLTPFASLIGH